jgi:hypothetical protein
MTIANSTSFHLDLASAPDISFRFLAGATAGKLSLDSIPFAETNAHYYFTGYSEYWDSFACMLLSESALSKEWNSQEEDEAWADL